MKLTCATHHLQRALSIAERFTGKNLTLPILGNALLEAGGNGIRIIATNLEYAVEVEVPGVINASGRVSVPAKILSAFVQSLKEEKTDLEVVRENLRIRTDTRDTRINGTSTEEFPLLPTIKKTHEFRAPPSFFSKSVRKILPACSQSEFKPELAGVFFSISADGVRVAATDTFRLAEHTFLFPEKRKDESFSFILPHRTAQEASRIFEDCEEDITVSLGENQVVFEGGGIRVTSRLVEGAFPAYAAIIPKQFETTCFLNREEMVRAVRGSSIFASKLQEVGLRFHAHGLEVTAVNAEVGEYTTRVAAQKTGNDLAINFNHHYLLDGLNALDQDDLFIGLNNENAPSLLRNKEDASFLYVIMPIRTT